MGTPSAECAKVSVVFELVKAFTIEVFVELHKQRSWAALTGLGFRVDVGVRNVLRI